jgi:trafficking protein particle complex subunit 1
MNSDAPPSPLPPLLQTPAHQQPAVNGHAPSNSSLPFDEEAKLVYGVIVSLRAMVKKLSGRLVEALIPVFSS